MKLTRVYGTVRLSPEVAEAARAAFVKAIKDIVVKEWQEYNRRWHGYYVAARIETERCEQIRLWVARGHMQRHKSQGLMHRS